MHLDGRHDPAVRAGLFDRVLDGQRVDDGGQHAHVVGGNAVHVLRLLGDAAKKVAAPHHDGDLDPARGDLGHLRGDLVDARDIDAETPARGQRFP